MQTMRQAMVWDEQEAKEALPRRAFLRAGTLVRHEEVSQQGVQAMSDVKPTSNEFTTKLEVLLRQARDLANQMTTITREVSTMIAKAEISLREFRQTTLPLDQPKPINILPDERLVKKTNDDLMAAVGMNPDRSPLRRKKSKKKPAKKRSKR
jgi:hypothetical protein